MNQRPTKPKTFRKPAGTKPNQPTESTARKLPDAPAAPEAGERLQKVLSRAGLASRRDIEEWIREGRISLNGRVAQLGDRCHPSDRVTVNGRPIDLKSREESPTRVLLYHKPIGEVVTRRDPEGRPVIFTQLPRPERGRWIAVGRLDINTQGLILVTNDGELANRLMHPSREVEREYAVRVLGSVDDAMRERLLNGVQLDDGPAHFTTIRDAGGDGANHWFHVTTAEGRNRIVRRLWESQGVTVSRLIRVRFGTVELPPHLRAGAHVELPPEPLAALMQSVGLVPVKPRGTSKPTAGGPAGQRGGPKIRKAPHRSK